VECPRVPDVEGVPVAHSQAVAAEIRERAEFFSLLFEHASGRMRDYDAALDSLDDAAREVEQATRGVEAAKTEVELIRSRSSDGDPAIPAAPGPVADDALLAEALAALRDSEAALADAEAGREAVAQRLGEIEQGIGDTDTMIERYRQDPTSAASLIRRLKEEAPARDRG
jgi:chromosome segregation ATPase